MNLLRNIRDWALGQFIAEISAEDALCEFDCRKPQCTEGEWENCVRRLQHAAGELMPTNRPPSEAVAEWTPAKEADLEPVAELMHADTAVRHDSDRLFNLTALERGQGFQLP
jgi:hypothetical protein